MMRVLTVRQPWAWAIVHGGKDVENRVRSLGPYRGTVAIHVSQTPVRAGDDAWWVAHEAGMDTARDAGDDLHLGHVIGVVDLVDVHPDCTEHIEAYGHTPTCSPWAMAGHHHLTLANPLPLPEPIPARGRLGLWRPDADLETAIRGQLANRPEVAA